MVSGIVTRGLFYWLRAPRNNADIRADEWLLGSVRLLLGLCYLGALIRPGSIDESRTYETLAIVYLTYGLLILLLLDFRQHLSPLIQIAIHVLDIVWATQLATFIHWPAMAFLLFFFVIVGSVFCWGFWEAHLTLAAYFTFWVLGCYLHHPEHLTELLSQSSLTLVPEALLYVGLSCTAGLLAEAKSVRSESQAISSMTNNLRHEPGLERAISGLCAEGRQLFGATQVLVVAQEQNTNRATLYRSIPSQPNIHIRELGPHEQLCYLFPEPGESMRLTVGRHPGNRIRCHTLAEKKVKPSILRPEILSSFFRRIPFAFF